MPFHANVGVTSSLVFGNRRISSAGKSSQCTCNDTLAPEVWLTPFVRRLFSSPRFLSSSCIATGVSDTVLMSCGNTKPIFYIEIEVVSLTWRFLASLKTKRLGWFIFQALTVITYGLISIISTKTSITSLILSIFNFSCPAYLVYFLKLITCKA